VRGDEVALALDQIEEGTKRLLRELRYRQLRIMEAAARRSVPLEASICRICGGPIGGHRLSENPGAVLCAACALLAERARGLLEPSQRRN